MPIIKCSGSFPDSFTTRRGLLTLFGALALVGCQGETTSVRFKVIAPATVDGRPAESSSVMEVSYSKVTHSLIGNGGITRLYGEALIFDLGGRGTVYILPIRRPPSGSIIYNIYEFSVLRTFGVKNSVGSLTSADFDTLRMAKGRRPYNVDNSQLPTIIAFADEENPKTVYEIDPAKLGTRFPGVVFKRFDIEITDEPLTTKLRTQLPWLNSSKRLFQSDPPGHLRPIGERPISFVLTKDDFFGNGSR
ncbi:hypothetical protein GGI64_001081 [Rhizobium leguminosarum]|uniref:Uncharacterized protein n=1 Tax=Rhizobium leguminosarum TaxID=384 RepID=A0A7Z0DVE3_RHILE|nr:hypothetical protein [Rhizobium leguminosarum]NYJ10062.1 hypothetical protein [Rhizobium leguminosarum]